MAIEKTKKKKLDNILGQLNKKFGDGTVNYVSNLEEILKTKFFKTPSHKFNLLTGGGIPVGKTTELYGETGSGKTMLAIETIKKNQEEDPNFVAGWFETEGSMSSDTLRDMGVDMDRLIYWDQRNISAEKGFDILISLVYSGEFDMIVINSIAGLSAQKEIDDDMDKQNIALIARMLSKLFRIVTGAASKNNCSLIFINQTRDNVGVMFGDTTTTPGGKALKFYANLRVAMSKIKVQKSDPVTEDNGMVVRCRVKKNRAVKGNPYQFTDYYVEYGKGINSIFEIPSLLIDRNILTQTGAWIRYFDEKTGDVRKDENGKEMKWNGQNALLKNLLEDDKLREYFTDLIYKSMAETVSYVEEKDIEEVDEEEAVQEIMNA